jgi:hypothetical protein
MLLEATSKSAKVFKFMFTRFGHKVMESRLTRLYRFRRVDDVIGAARHTVSPALHCTFIHVRSDRFTLIFVFELLAFLSAVALQLVLHLRTKRVTLDAI